MAEDVVLKISNPTEEEQKERALGKLLGGLQVCVAKTGNPGMIRDNG